MTAIVELQLDKFNVPDAIKRTCMGVVNHVKMYMSEEVLEDVDGMLGLTLTEALMKEVLEYAEQLETRVQDEIDKTRPLEEVEQIEDEFVSPDSEDVTLHMVDGEAYQAVIGGVVFGKFCNEIVDPTGDVHTYCVKQFGHASNWHEDKEGNTRV